MENQPMIYVKSGGLTNPDIPATAWDKSMPGDAPGRVIFEGLAPRN